MKLLLKKIGKDRFKITATNKTWKNIAQGREKNMSSLKDNSSKSTRTYKIYKKKKGYDKSTKRIKSNIV